MVVEMTTITDYVSYYGKWIPTNEGVPIINGETVMVKYTDPEDAKDVALTLKDGTKIGYDLARWEGPEVPYHPMGGQTRLGWQMQLCDGDEYERVIAWTPYPHDNITAIQCEDRMPDAGQWVLSACHSEPDPDNGEICGCVSIQQWLGDKWLYDWIEVGFWYPLANENE